MATGRAWHSPRSVRIRAAFVFLLACALAGLAAPRQQRAAAPAPALDIRAFTERPAVKAAVRSLEAQYEQVVHDLVMITEIPAPSFKEQARARYIADKMREAGLRNVRIDDEGNVLGERPGVNEGPTLMLAAHLDTVFPEGIEIKVKKNGTIYAAPGIGDDSYGLSVLLAVARAMEAARVRTIGSILFAADVGEEGLGNLRGMRYLFEKNGSRRRIDMFVSLDGVGDSGIINGGVASKRYRVTFRGPGGHSYAAFGLVNPAYAMAGAVNRLSRIRVPRVPKTTLNVGMYGGGTSVNSIPSSVWMEVDLRSEASSELAKLEQQFLSAVTAGVAGENRARRTDQGMIVAEPKLVGERKGGRTPASAPIVQTAAAVTRALGMSPVLLYGSTDANVPMGLGVPAITIGAGAKGGRAHALDEWVDVNRAGALPGMERALLLALALVGLE